MTVIFSSKCSKFYVDSENAMELWENFNGFEDKWVWACGGSFYQLWEEYMWLAFYVLKSGPKISDPTERHDTQLNLFDINGTLP